MEILNTISIITAVILLLSMIFLKYKEIKNNKPKVKLYIAPMYLDSNKVFNDIIGYSLVSIWYKNISLKGNNAFELNTHAEGMITFGNIERLTSIKFISSFLKVKNKEEEENLYAIEINKAILSVILKIESALSFCKDIEIVIINTLDNKISSSSKLENNILSSEVFKEDMDLLRSWLVNTKMDKITFYYPNDLHNDFYFTEEKIKELFR